MKLVLLLCIALFVSVTCAYGPVLKGYDVVAYFSLKPDDNGIQGSKDLAFNFTGYEFWFSTPANMALFKANPWKYAPKYGGFCAWGICCEKPPQWPWAKNNLGPPADPATGWKIYNNELYVAIGRSYVNRFLQDAEMHISEANERWSGWWGKVDAGPFNDHCYPENWRECAYPNILNGQ
mmetsp:Transcript_15630/g.17375  ORF Transcript_15630/g.17375 Transcript_15630/m.17375 type:complete len:179 (-) Transcript_15630:27-563(-)|eukprot:CAMPEP_0168518894 /NCGR_PEP_ID=MMETSP0405-20121227/6993_1 /TAXON_ID=498012 /ORGANISM="Trichosphaerium sp, Strain Am-I-7 wt" /LENGTH=178 /DNA_ID=CAMNT_0008539331 /DNA_START=14 /DNA_END=550 /DNA_ORIENTATION=+